MRFPLRVAGPRLQTDETTGRHATWFELFFDLVFVVAVAELAHDLATDVTGLRLVGFVGLFVPIFIVWMNFSYYADLFGEEGLDRVGLFVAMFVVAALATTLHDALAGQLRGFIVSYLALRVVLLVLYARARMANPDVRQFTGRYIALYGLGALFWVAALAFDGLAQFVLVGIGLAIEIVTPGVTYFTVDERPAQVSHMPERFGLFTIIVLGEVVVAVVSGISGTEWSVPAVGAAVASFVAAVAVWRLYFAYVREDTITDLVRGDFDFFAGMGYTYGHFGVTLGITAAGVGSLLVIVAAGEGVSVAFFDRLALGGGVAVFLLGIALTHGAVGTISQSVAGVWVAGSFVAVVFAVSIANPVVLVTTIALLLGALAALEFVLSTDSVTPTPDAPRPPT
ncbi:hypothetical protein GJR96_14645 [Haloferax sp. MBLA0076]|uniref:Low temperature requirement protein A n=1 Tax=Haloferax litoreum TaxID=2666140 RepID=A0A6A8GN13_9EURY|nr:MULTISPECIES: low temperature requirement protein A [Haloferax]KAB1194613.1 low temperature requirement protein A [Haloferax sp. CBA1148]MRX23190.1 hypothetical protein [Haloferax litoreum]